MRCAARGTLFSSTAPSVRRRRLSSLHASLCVSSLRFQCSATLATTSTSLYGDMASFEMEGELLELRQEAARVMSQHPPALAAAPQTSVPLTSSSSYSSPSLTSSRRRNVRAPGARVVRPEPATTHTAAVSLPDPVTTPRWATQRGTRRLFTHGRAEYPRDSVAFLHGVIALPFADRVERLGACHVESLLVMLEYVARARSEATSLMPCKADWCLVERACWTALVVSSVSTAGRGTVSSKHIAHAAQSVALSLPASTGPAALPFLLVCYHHRRSLRRLQNVQVLDALLHVAPPGSFAFADQRLAKIADAVYESLLAHLLWRCITMNDKDFDTSPSTTAGTGTDLQCVIGGFDVVQLVEQTLLWRAAHVPAVVRQAALLWVQKHAQTSLSHRHYVGTRPPNTFAAVVRDPLLGPRPKTAQEREEKRAEATAAFDALRSTAAATGHFSVAEEIDAMLQSLRQPTSPLAKQLMRELAQAPCFAPASAELPVDDSPDTSAAAEAQLRTVLRALHTADGVARRDQLEAAQSTLLHVTDLPTLLDWLESDALRGEAVLRGTLVWQTLRALPYCDVNRTADTDSANLSLRLASSLVSALRSAGALPVLRAAVHVLPHWCALNTHASGTSVSARDDVVALHLVHLVPVSLVPVVLQQLVQDRALAAFRLPECVVSILGSLVSRVPAPPCATTTTAPTQPGLLASFQQLVEQEAQQAPLADASPALAMTMTALLSELTAASSAANVARGDMAGLDRHPHRAPSHTFGDLLKVTRLSDVELREIAQGWARLGQLAQLTGSLAEEVALWQRVSRGAFRCTAAAYNAVQWSEDEQTVSTNSSPTASSWPPVTTTTTAPQPLYVRQLRHRVDGRLLMRASSQLVTMVMGQAHAELKPASLVWLNNALAQLERTLATSAHPHVALVILYGMLRACGRCPVVVQQREAGDGLTAGAQRWAFSACPLCDAQPLETLVSWQTGSSLDPVSFLHAMPDVRDGFAALKDAVLAEPSRPSVTAKVLWCAAQTQLWCTLTALHLVSTAPHSPLPVSGNDTLPVLYHDAATTILHVLDRKAISEGTDLPVLSLDQALPQGVTLADIFTPALHTRVFDVACVHLTAEQTAELGQLAVTLTRTPALGLVGLPVPVAQMVVRRCVMSGVSVPASVRALLQPAPR